MSTILRYGLSTYGTVVEASYTCRCKLGNYTIVLFMVDEVLIMVKLYL